MFGTLTREVSTMTKRLLPIRAMCQRYGDVSDRTIDRWTAAGILPPPLIIRKRRYWNEEELEQRERAGMGRKPPGEVTRDSGATP
jgi:DNA-binding transcriptional MerR regulator